MRTNCEVSLERLKNVLNYDESTGDFYWNKTGGLAGNIDNKGYRRLSIDKVRYKAHRLAWFYTRGVWPDYQIDHINGDKLDNRIINLRDVPQSVNMYNKKRAHKNSKSFFLGVTKSGGRFYARLRTGNGVKYLGGFSSGEEAHEKYLKEKEMAVNGLPS